MHARVSYETHAKSLKERHVCEYSLFKRSQMHKDTDNAPRYVTNDDQDGVWLWLSLIKCPAENLTTYGCTKEGLHRHIRAQGLVWTRPLLTRPHACSTISILWEMTTNNLAVSSTGQTSYLVPNNHTVMYCPYHQDKIHHHLPLQITPTYTKDC